MHNNCFVGSDGSDPMFVVLVHCEHANLIGVGCTWLTPIRKFQFLSYQCLFAKSQFAEVCLHRAAYQRICRWLFASNTGSQKRLQKGSCWTETSLRLQNQYRNWITRSRIFYSLGYRAHALAQNGVSKVGFGFFNATDRVTCRRFVRPLSCYLRKHKPHPVRPFPSGANFL